MYIRNQDRGLAFQIALTIMLLFMGVAAYAQSYTLSFSGGVISPAPPLNIPFTYGSGGCSASAQNSSPGGSSSISGALVATATWNGGTNNDPPPAEVIIEQHSITSWSAPSFNGEPGGSGSCDDGLPPHTVNPGGAGSVSEDTWYTIKNNPGTSFTLSVTVSATCTINNNGFDAMTTASYAVNVYPISVQPSGATADSSGNLDILVGQHCSASLSGVPTACAVSNYQWSVSGTTFQSWSPETPAMNGNPYNGDASYEVDGPGSLTNATAGWYWNDRNSGTSETVSCTATVTPPSGEGSAFIVTLTQNVTVYLPTWMAYGIGTSMNVNGFLDAPDYYLRAGYLLRGEDIPGMSFVATVSPPSNTPTSFGNGSLALVQLVIPEVTYTTLSLPVFHSVPENGEECLDTSYPYPWVISNPYSTNDSPALDLTASEAITAQLGDQFEDFLLYFAPSSTQCVPVAYFAWSIDGNATIPTSGDWADLGTEAAGTVSSSGGLTNFLPGNSFPNWTQIVGN